MLCLFNKTLPYLHWLKLSQAVAVPTPGAALMADAAIRRSMAGCQTAIISRPHTKSSVARMVIGAVPGATAAIRHITVASPAAAGSKRTSSPRNDRAMQPTSPRARGEVKKTYAAFFTSLMLVKVMPGDRSRV